MQKRRLTGQLDRKWEESEKRKQGCVDGEHATEEKTAQLPKPASLNFGPETSSTIRAPCAFTCIRELHTHDKSSSLIGETTLCPLSALLPLTSRCLDLD